MNTTNRPEPIQTLAPETAHNALATAVQMYSGIIADMRRAQQMLQAQLDRTIAIHARQLEEGKAENGAFRDENEMLKKVNAGLREQWNNKIMVAEDARKEIATITASQMKQELQKKVAEMEAKIAEKRSTEL